MKFKKLSEICSYRKEKVLVSALNKSNYISTENMLPNKGGIDKASSLPSVNSTQSYKAGDVLVSNIRPYFKKIWQAVEDGGCSNDVLVFTPNVNIDPTFLYYLLSQDDFFSYAMATSKGTKMPRGDKSAIMEYQIPELPIDTQKCIANILKVIDEKININKQINENLVEQISEIYRAWFIDFLPFNGMCPNTWHSVFLSDIASISSGKRPINKFNTPKKNATIPIVGASSVVGYTDKANHRDKILVIGRVGTHGVVQRFSSACWASDNTLVLNSKYYEYVAQILKRIDYSTLNRGSTQPLITLKDMNKIRILKPDDMCLANFEKITSVIMTIHSKNLHENDILSELRDTLITKLISGEFDLSTSAL